MCGICGIVDFEGRVELEAAVEKMTALLVHRGPDDGDVRVFASHAVAPPIACLGHRRLSIIDLSDAGRQPMSGRTGETAVVLNGEIYNFREKREECPDYPFRSRTDTEVILALYEKYGEDFVEHLDGMFAFALWDSYQKKLILARDRAGKKPLYYFNSGGFFAFASEIKSLLALAQVPQVVDDEALPLYLTFGYVPTPGTFYRDIKKLQPATVMVVESGGKTRSRSFWTYPLVDGDRNVTPARQEDPRLTLRALLRDAVERRLIADVPLGAFLSGGVDSSIVVGIMSSMTREPVRTFSIGFDDDPSYDETPYARLVADHFKTRHEEFRVRPHAIELLEKLLWLHDEPFGDSSAIPTYLVSQLTREHVTVALSGDGGDEVFAGYERFAAALWTERLPRSAFAAANLLTKFLPAPGHAKSTRRRIKRFFEKAGLPLLDRYLEWNSFFTRAELATMLVKPCSVDVARSFRDYIGGGQEHTLLKRILHLNFRTYLLDDLLVKTDRMSMAHGLEVRCPFLDTRLIEWAAGLPDGLKIRMGRLKHILREAFRDMLPAPILKRGKMGFGVPLGSWMRNELRDFSHDILLGPSARVGSLIDKNSIQSLLQDHVQQRHDHGQKIWALLSLEVWLRSIARSKANPVTLAEIHSA